MTKSRRKSFFPTVYTITVSGRGEFPIDMLRQNLCFPKSEEDSEIIAKTFRRDDKNASRQVQVVSSSMPPDENLWKHFGWTVVGFE